MPNAALSPSNAFHDEIKAKKHEKLADYHVHHSSSAEGKVLPLIWVDSLGCVLLIAHRHGHHRLKPFLLLPVSVLDATLESRGYPCSSDNVLPVDFAFLLACFPFYPAPPRRPLFAIRVASSLASSGVIRT